ncbi:MAG TPA: SGNH/GDSL hydrolase family protein [Parafilimonas sp.]|nr:SGNH/GDSL hydrolase family protein [Parafilimonas sp.]
MKKYLIVPSLLFILFEANAQPCTKSFHIVILGSSTAYGNGASNITKSWAYKYAEYLKSINSDYVVDNLAVAGTTTYSAQADNYVPPQNRPQPLAGHNISTAIRLHADAIIINFPSNDAADNFTVTEQENNFKRITEKAANHNILVWVATPQPRDDFNETQVKRQKKLYDWIMSFYGKKAIDFHTGLASAADSILYKYSAGDGIHLDDRGHERLYVRVVNESIPDSLCNLNMSVPIAKQSPAINKNNISGTY